jgi:superfamily II DNA/RNA helicase
MSTPTFAALGVPADVAERLERRGITTPFPIQAATLVDALAGRDVCGKAPTGSGKTLAFGIPLVTRVGRAKPRQPRGLVLVPTRELANQVRDELVLLAGPKGVSVEVLYGGVGFGNQINALRRGVDVIVACPGRLADLVNRREVRLDAVEIAVLDEADRMADMGFLPEVRRLMDQVRSDRQTLLFSATLDGEVGRIASAYTHDARRHEHAPTEQRKADVEHRFIRVRHEAKIDHLVDELRDGDRGRTLVFVRTKRGADRLVKRLVHHDVRAVAMHGDKSQSQREKALSRFESGRIDTLVATDVAARGIDVADITHVINFDAPGQREDYVHRVGRTARAGASGVGITFVVDDQEREVAKMATELGLQRELEAAGMQATQTRPPAGRGPRRPNRPAGRRRR